LAKNGVLIVELHIEAGERFPRLHKKLFQLMSVAKLSEGNSYLVCKGKQHPVLHKLSELPNSQLRTN